ncbi:MAG TPA: GNAT family protein [Pseudonocardiaceae bacterium]|nr:GNAT family protein [Pseudonocardiaceae bacterium]
MSSPVTLASRPTLTGERVVLRPLTVDDVPHVMAGLQDTESIRLTGTHRTFTTDQVRTAITAWQTAPDRIDMAVIEKATGHYAGEVVLNDLDVDNQSCNFRIALTGPYTNRGLGTEATRLMLGHAFDTVGVHRVELDVYSFNPRARRVYEKVGFRYEGTKRHALRWHGEWVDCVVMAMLADDWALQRVAAVTNGRVTRLPAD